MHKTWLLGVALAVVCAAPALAGTFGDDVAFLKEHTNAVLLEDGGRQVALVPEYQGRVMTSTVAGAGGYSHGWINRERVASDQFAEHINVFGGEDRFWLGPEGGQYAIYFKPGTGYVLEDWYVPAPIDTEPWKTVKAKKKSAKFAHDFTLTNKAGTAFIVHAERWVRLRSKKAVEKDLGITLPDELEYVAYETENKVSNRGEKPWRKETGLLAIWILGMYPPSPETTVVIPFNEGSENELGPIVNDEYFGKVPADRLEAADGVIYFDGDGQHRSKIGLTPKRSKGVLGSYDAANQALTIVTFNQPEDHAGYVNNMWEDQKEPYNGDAIMAYNDGPPGPGKPPLGPFYELEAAGPAMPLEPGGSYTHFQRTVHFEGPKETLNAVAESVLGVGLDTIQEAL